MSATSLPAGPGPRLTARIAGAFWLISVVAGIYAEVFVRGTMIVHGDAAATATRIMAAQPMFRIGFVADLIGDMAYLGTTLLLYRLLKAVNRTVALTMFGFGLAGVAVMAANLINLMAPLILLNGTRLSCGAGWAFAPLVLVYLRLHGFGYAISIALFSVQVAAMGWLILRSRFFPRVFGILFIIEAICDTVSTFGGFLEFGWVERIDSYILLPGLAAEGGFALWLLLIGVDAGQWIIAQKGNVEP